MERHQVRLLPVVEEQGMLLGLITEARILEAWEVDPLQRVSEVMEECGPPVEEEGQEWCQAGGPDWGQRAFGS